MVSVSDYVPNRGDVVWITLNPQSGHEKAGRRPAIVLSPRSYNEKTGLAIVCPVTGHVKRYPFEVNLPEGLSVSGVILSDQVKSLNWKTRRAEFICSLPENTVNEVLQKLGLLLSI